MNRGIEIVRRLLLTASWAFICILTFGSTIIGIKEYTENYLFLNIKNIEEAERIAAIVAENDQLDDEKNVIIYEAYPEKSVSWGNVKSDLEAFYDKREKKRKEMWFCIGFSIVCLPIGFLLHKLINWIIVHKPA